MESSRLLLGAALPMEKLLTPPIIWLGVVIVILLIAVALLKNPSVKGWLGELQVNLFARLLLDKQKYHLIRNVTIPSGDGTTQIDHVIVSRYGVFVIETKNMSGWIFGAERDAQWTQKFPKSSNRFQNPLRQNYKHTETLAALLGLPRDRIRSVVVFIGGAKLKKEVPANVTIAGGYVRYIKSHKDEILSDEEVRQVLETIESARLAPSLRTHRQHVEHVKTIIAAKVSTSPAPAAQPAPSTPASRSAKQPEKAAPAPAASPAVTSPAVPANQPRVTEPASAQQAPACPQCGGQMVLRTARRGQKAGQQFWGCSGYPKCSGVRSLT